MKFLDAIFGIVKFIRDAIGRPMREWAQFAAENPVAAGYELFVVANLLDARADALRRQDGWRARRNRAAAKRLRTQADELIGKGVVRCPWRG